MKEFRESDRLARYTKADLETLGFVELEGQNNVGSNTDFLKKGKDNVIYRFGKDGDAYKFQYSRNVPKRDDPSKQTRPTLKTKDNYKRWVSKE